MAVAVESWNSVHAAFLLLGGLPTDAGAGIAICRQIAGVLYDWSTQADHLLHSEMLSGGRPFSVRASEWTRWLSSER